MAEITFSRPHLQGFPLSQLNCPALIQSSRPVPCPEWTFAQPADALDKRLLSPTSTIHKPQPVTQPRAPGSSRNWRSPRATPRKAQTPPPQPDRLPSSHFATQSSSPRVFSQLQTPQSLLPPPPPTLRLPSKSHEPPIWTRPNNPRSRL